MNGNVMKKILALILAMLCVVVLCACTSGTTTTKETEAKADETEAKAEETEAKVEETEAAITGDEPIEETKKPASDEPEMLTYLVDWDSIQSDNVTYDGETADNIFDESEYTKWCLNFIADDKPTVSFKLDETVVVTGCEFWSTNDTADWVGRNVGLFTLYGSTDGEDWKEIVCTEALMYSDNICPGDVVEISGADAYQYFKLVIEEPAGGDDTSSMSDSGKAIVAFSQFNLYGKIA